MRLEKVLNIPYPTSWSRCIPEFQKVALLASGVVVMSAVHREEGQSLIHSFPLSLRLRFRMAV